MIFAILPVPYLPVLLHEFLPALLYGEFHTFCGFIRTSYYFCCFECEFHCDVNNWMFCKSHCLVVLFLDCNILLINTDFCKYLCLSFRVIILNLHKNVVLYCKPRTGVMHIGNNSTCLV